MHDDDHDGSELFEGQIEISSLERGATFGIDEETYFRMASCAITAGGVGIEPCTICKLPDDQRGCELVLFGEKRTLSFWLCASCASRAPIAVFAEPLDGLTCWIPLYEGQDCDVHWSRALRSMCAVESIGYYDQFWAAEQGEGGGEATT